MSNKSDVEYWSKKNKEAGGTGTALGSIDTSAAQSAIDLDNQYLESLKKQTASLSAMPKKLQEAYEVGKSNLQSQAAQALAGTRLVRGGKGLAASRQTAISSGKALGEMESQKTLAQGQAEQEALKASTAELGEEKKIKEASALREAQVAEATALVDRIIDEESGYFVTSASDINNMKRRFKEEIMTTYANNPKAIQAALARFNLLLGQGKTTELLTQTSSASSISGGYLD